MTRRAALGGVVLALLAVACDPSDEVRSTPSVDTTSTTGIADTADDALAAPVSTQDSAATGAPTTIVVAAPPSESPSTVPPSTDPPSTESPSTVPPSTVPDCLAAMTQRAKVALLVWPAVYSQAWDTAIEVVRDHDVGGVLLMEPSGWSAADVSPRLDQLEEVAASGLVVATDEEGGDVQRLRLLGEVPSQQAVSDTMTPTEAQTMVAEHAAVLRDVGIDVVFAPVVDIVPAGGDVPLNPSRFFSGNANRVTEFARAYLAGWAEHDIVPVLKHFPGHGSASADSHIDAAVTDPLDELLVSDLVPYRELAGTGAGVMVGHLTVPGLTGDVPASRSPAALDLLRDTLGHGDALVVSDALGMAATGVPVEQAAIDAIAAGIDVVVFSETELAGPVIDAITREVGSDRLPETRIDAAAQRVLRISGADALGCDPG